MFSRIVYILRETFANFTRNFTLTLAALITIFISLTLVGFTRLVNYGVENQLLILKDGVEVSIFMNADATTDQIDAVKVDLENNGLVKSARYVTKQEAQEEIKRLFPKSPEIALETPIESIPTSFRIVPTTTESDAIIALTNQYRNRPGVYVVSSADDAIDFIRKVSSFVRWGSRFGTVFAGAAAILLIWNTIRTAMFARRREIEVMKLVGATNWFIRWPFILEGVAQGALGAGLACGSLWFGKNLWAGKVLNSLSSSLSFENLQATPRQFWFICILLMAAGVIAGGIVSAVAATRFLDV